MKIFILLALVGASLCNGFGGVPRPPSGYGSSYGSYGQDGGKEGGGWKGWVGWDNGGNVGSGGNDWGSWGNGGSGGNDWGSWGNGGSGGNNWGSGGGKGGSGGNTGGSDGGKGGHGGGEGSQGHGGGHGGGGGSEGHGGSESWSSWSPEKCNSPKPNYKDDKDCMNHALEQFPKLLSSVGGYLCKHKDKKTKWSQEEYEELKSHMETSLGCSGCSLGGILDWKQQLGEATSGVGKSAAELLPGVEDLAKSLGMDKVLFGATCSLLGGVLTSECKDKLIGSDVSNLVDNMQGALCEKDKQMDEGQLVTTVVRAGCLGSEAVGMDKKSLDTLTKGFGGALAPIAKALLALLKGLDVASDVASDLLCSLLKTVTSTLGLGSNNGEGGDKGGGLLQPVTDLLSGVLGGGGDKGKGGGLPQPDNDLLSGGGGSGGGDKGKGGGILSRLLGK